MALAAVLVATYANWTRRPGFGYAPAPFSSPDAAEQTHSSSRANRIVQLMTMGLGRLRAPPSISVRLLPEQHNKSHL